MLTTAVRTAGRVRRRMRRARRLVELERTQYPGALHPSMWRRGFISTRYYGYPGVQDPSLPYVSDVKVETLLRTLNSPVAVDLLQDKNAFADALVARGLADAGPELYGTVLRGSLRPRSPGALERLRAADAVIVKPIDGSGGRGVRVMAGAEVASARWARDDEVVVQELLRQHPALLAINPASLNTLRVLAVRLPEHGPVLGAAVHRWGTAATGAVDNVSAGGLCSPVDLATGVLGPAVGRPRERRRVEHDHHPDTGARITGALVPQWPQVLELAETLMEAFTEVDHVGWDLCVTDRGVRVVEGNAGTPNLNVFQFHGPFLHDARLRRYYVERGLLARRHA
jgi:glutathione synthase/RimK-type ligase-like ATP-grasp enzyme